MGANKIPIKAMKLKDIKYFVFILMKSKLDEILLLHHFHSL